MASSGITAWTKHYQGKGDIETVMKKNSPVYDVENPNKKITDITAGTKVVYLKTKNYESKAIVKFVHNGKNIEGRVVFDCIAKPGVKSSSAMSLKPQTFNIGDTKYTFSEYRRQVIESIEENKRLSGELRSYLYAIFDYYSGGSTTPLQVKKIFEEVQDSIPINDINKDFGEVLGSVAILQFGLLKKARITLSKSSCKIYVPLRPNEPLMDYGIINGDTQYVISAKSGKSTNVVKPRDVIDLLKKNDEKFKKWSNTKQQI